MTEDTEFSASASSLDNTGEEWEEPGLAAECSQAQGHCSLLSFLVLETHVQGLDRNLWKLFSWVL